MIDGIQKVSAAQVAELILQGEEPPQALLNRAYCCLEFAEGTPLTDECQNYIAEAKRSLQAMASVLHKLNITLRDAK